ncbi:MULTISPECIES: diacylglycerol kinase [Stenotrophomonas]|uniref:Diacylglycerol kinase n=1 Tax=Stenotrophomonas lactitubi TaxID=2045214 RepID=A0AAW4GBP8_9GAMM|nr:MULTISPECIES: diacylglycerol kinase [Stenotrophomonas]MBM9912193.1 diacylglycerol kinase [Stenotrophomonas lactitubi]MBM9920769.1 diacylglycerol kinase [Stenotrophomonas lactitubi]MBM9937789.1 diacylglycerol kinase [Stenotrophomonas lactitubi]NYU00133.1 diacylglycerol kinase [Stenotrophomonas sp. SbOxS2]
MQPGHPNGNGKYPHGKTGLRRIFHTLIHSRDGFIATFRGEAAFRQLLLLHGALAVVAFLLDVSRSERALMLVVCFISLMVELLNSAIEAVVDRISLEHHPLSKNAKDMGSAAQTTALLMVATVWAVVLLG